MGIRHASLRSRTARLLGAMALAHALTALAAPARADDEPAQPLPVITAIHFSGNDITQPSTMLREMTARVGDRADPVAIERSRQAIQDLGLFQDVAIEQLAVTNGVDLLVHVHEKWYLLPLPRIEGNAQGNYGYGGQLTWNNLWGLNHTVHLLAVQRRLTEATRRGELEVAGSYQIPFLHWSNPDSRNGLLFSASHEAQSSLNATGRPYDERIDTAEVQGLRALSAGPRSQGLGIGVGLRWQGDETSGRYAPPSPHSATSLVGTLRWNRLHYLIYSEEGASFSARAELAQDGWLSGYSYSQFTAEYRQAWLVGTTAHQEVQLYLSTGSYFGGAPGRLRRAFSLGSSSSVQGYDSGVQQGDFYGYAAGEFLRPVFWDSLRAVAFVQAGRATHGLTQTDGSPVLVAVGLGLRLRIRWLVDLEIQGGVAMPLTKHRGHLRIFAGNL